MGGKARQFNEKLICWGSPACSNLPVESMEEITQMLDAVERGDTEAAEELLPATYEILRRIAASKMANERDGHTLQPTALAHEAYLRLLRPDGEKGNWNSEAHFFSAAAEAMRRILIEHARKRQSLKRGGEHVRTTLDESSLSLAAPDEEILSVHEALEKLETEDPDLARVVKLRYFAGLTVAETAAALGVSESGVKRSWRCARAWLFREIGGDFGAPEKKT
jgi:RNA polymerase sigma factor (TIGR02999 family)